MSETLQGLSAQFGTGNLALDLTVVAVVFGGLVFLAALVTWGLTRKPDELELRVDRFDTMLGRLERTERTLHEFRSDVLRSLELSRADFEFMRGELETVRALLEEEATAFEKRERRPSREDLASRAKRLPGFVESQPDALQTGRRDSLGLLKASKEPGSEPKGAVAALHDALHRSPEAVMTPGVDRVGTGSQTDTAQQDGVRARPLSALGARLEKTRKGLFDRFKGVFTGRPKVDADTIDELEAVLVGSDLGVKNIRETLSAVRDDLSNGVDLSEGGVKAIVKSKLLALLERGSPISAIPTPRRTNDGPFVLLVVGVNGAGKTTSAAKLAARFQRDGASTILVAADTFRAAAVEQLHEWGRRIGVPVVSGAENAKPQTVVYDAMQRAMSDRVDCVIIDTAGRLHTKQSLMDELSGIRNAIEKHVPGAPHEVLLVLDGSTGQNALNQAREFNASAGLTGLIVTKLDGTSKGGIVVAIKEELGIPVRYIGVGEKAEDLEPFSPRDFVEAIFAA